MPLLLCDSVTLSLSSSIPALEKKQENLINIWQNGKKDVLLHPVFTALKIR